MSWWAVALGGALGSVGRYATAQWAIRYLGLYLPWGTLIVNAAGSFIIGIVWMLVQNRLQSHSELIRLFLMVGFLGGFTTFSTFSLDTIQYLSGGQWLRASLNIALNLAFCLLGVAAGLGLGSWLFER